MRHDDNTRAILRGEGDLFRRERLRHRLSVGQVAEATHLRPRVIQAIEAGDGGGLPSFVFTKGLVQTYARYLGLDPEPYLEAFREATEASVEVEIRPESRQVRYRAERVPGFIVPTVLSILLIVLAGYLYQQYTAFVSGSGLNGAVAMANSQIAPTPLPATATAIPTIVASATKVPEKQTPVPTRGPQATPTEPVPTPTPVPPTATPHPQGVRIDVQISGRVWAEVVSDGQIVFTGILNSGDKRTWTASNSLMLWSGNAGLMTVTYNGKSLGRLGSPGEVTKVTWTATQ